MISENRYFSLQLLHDYLSTQRDVHRGDDGVSVWRRDYQSYFATYRGPFVAVPVYTAPKMTSSGVTCKSYKQLFRQKCQTRFRIARFSAILLMHIIENGAWSLALDDMVSHASDWRPRSRLVEYLERPP